MTCENMKVKTIPWLLLALSVIVSLWLHIDGRKPPQAEKPKVNVRYVTDTVTAPRPRDSTIVRTDTVWLTAVRQKVIRDTVWRDSLTQAVVPITQKHYGDTAYDAWVSGFRARLDSIRIRHRTVTVTNTIYKELPTKEKRWNVSLQAGYGFTPNGAQPYVGIGVGYAMWRW